MSRKYLPLKLGNTMNFLLEEDREDGDPFDGIEIMDSQGNEAAIIPTDTIKYSDELAAFIIQACNSFDDLLAACKAAYEAMIIRYDAGIGGDFWNETTAQMRAAIEKAERGTQ